jgi:DNA sulfur modification protein DndB
MDSPHDTDIFSYRFPVIKGIQANREYYITMVPMRLIPNLFLFNEDEIPPDLRAQRRLNKSRIPALTNYLLNNRDNYIFSSLTASIDRLIEFDPIPPNNKNSKIGSITIPADTKIIINDGQHRRAAIIEALKQRPDLGYETISVVFYIDTGLKRSQQMFADLNRYAIKPSGSLSILYDNRDNFSRFILEMIDSVPIFQNNVDFEKTSISNRSTKVFTLSSVYRATKSLLGSMQPEEKNGKEITIEFWNETTSNMKPWLEFLRGKQSYILRQETVAVHDLTLQSLANIGSILLQNYPDKWKTKLSRLGEINWLRSNPDWEVRAVVANRLLKSYSNVVLTTNYLKIKLDLPLTDKDLEYEAKIRK